MYIHLMMQCWFDAGIVSEGHDGTRGGFRHHRRRVISFYISTKLAGFGPASKIKELFNYKGKRETVSKLVYGGEVNVLLRGPAGGRETLGYT